MAVHDIELKAEFYYHGTSKHYFETQVKKYGKYQHDPQQGADTSLFIGLSKENSQGYAKDRTERNMRLGDIPLLLIIKGDKIRNRIREHPVVADLVVDSLSLDEFVAEELKIK